MNDDGDGRARGPESRLVDLAVALSARADRAARSEQWHADLRDAGQLGLPRVSIALAALTTAILHRRATRPSSWHGLAPWAPFRRGATRSSWPVAGAFVSLAVGVALLLAKDTSWGEPAIESLQWWATVFLTVVPGLLVMAALALPSESTGPAVWRRVVGCLGCGILVVVFAETVQGALYPAWLGIGIASTGILAVWLFGRARRDAAWAFVAGPPLVVAIGWPLQLAVEVSVAVPPSLGLVLVWVVILAAFAAASAGAIAAARLARPGAAGAAAAATAAGNVAPPS